MKHYNIQQIKILSGYKTSGMQELYVVLAVLKREHQLRYNFSMMMAEAPPPPLHIPARPLSPGVRLCARMSYEACTGHSNWMTKGDSP